MYFVCQSYRNGVLCLPVLQERLVPGSAVYFVSQSGRNSWSKPQANQTRFRPHLCRENSDSFCYKHKGRNCPILQPFPAGMYAAHLEVILTGEEIVLQFSLGIVPDPGEVQIGTRKCVGVGVGGCEWGGGGGGGVCMWRGGGGN